MNIVLWVLQVLAALLYGASGVMKVFMFDKISQDVLRRVAAGGLDGSRRSRARLRGRADRPRRPSGGIRSSRWWPPRSWPSRASCSSACT